MTPKEAATKITASTPISLALMGAIVAVAFSSGILWEKVAHHDTGIDHNYQLIRELKELSADNKRRIDNWEKYERN